MLALVQPPQILQTASLADVLACNAGAQGVQLLEIQTVKAVLHRGKAEDIQPVNALVDPPRQSVRQPSGQTALDHALAQGSRSVAVHAVQIGGFRRQRAGNRRLAAECDALTESRQEPGVPRALVQDAQDLVQLLRRLLSGVAGQSRQLRLVQLVLPLLQPGVEGGFQNVGAVAAVHKGPHFRQQTGVGLLQPGAGGLHRLHVELVDPVVDQIQIGGAALGVIGAAVDLVDQSLQPVQIALVAVQRQLAQLGQLAALELGAQDLQGLLADRLREIGIPDRLGQIQQRGAVHLFIAGNVVVHLLALQIPAAAVEGGAQLGGLRLLQRQRAGCLLHCKQGGGVGSGDALQPVGERSALRRLLRRGFGLRRFCRRGSGFRWGGGFLGRGSLLRCRRGLKRCGFRSGRHKGRRRGRCDLLQTGDQRRNAGVFQSQAELERGDVPAADGAAQVAGHRKAWQRAVAGAEAVVEAIQLCLLLLGELPALRGEQKESGRFGADGPHLRGSPAQILQPAQQPGHGGAQGGEAVGLGQNEDRGHAALAGVSRHLGEQIALRAVFQTLGVDQAKAAGICQSERFGQNLQQGFLARAGERKYGCRKRNVHGNTSFMFSSCRDSVYGSRRLSRPGSSGSGVT